MNPQHVVLVTDDSGLVAGMSAAFADHASPVQVEAIACDADWSETEATADLVILDGSAVGRVGPPATERFPDALILRLRDDGELEFEVESHQLPDAHGYVRREDLGTLAPVVVALAAISVRRG